jgi:Ni,Fe-hydrogenase I cytochrome b subunit
MSHVNENFMKTITFIPPGKYLSCSSTCSSSLEASFKILKLLVKVMYVVIIHNYTCVVLNPEVIFLIFLNFVNNQRLLG